jgi:ribosome-associated protein
MEVRDLTSIADYFIICSGRSDRQVQSIAQGIEENVAKFGVRPLSVEGLTRGQWVLMDFSDVIVHIFYQPVREFYDLERLWGHAPRVELPEPYATLVHQFRTEAQEPL